MDKLDLERGHGYSRRRRGERHRGGLGVSFGAEKAWGSGVTGTEVKSLFLSLEVHSLTRDPTLINCNSIK